METETNQLLTEESEVASTDEVTPSPSVDESNEGANDSPSATDNTPKKKGKIKLTGDDVKKFLKLFVVLCILSFIRAFSMHMFIFPNGFAPGGLTGIASIIYNAVGYSNPTLADTWFNPALVSVLLNLPLFIVGFFFLDRKFLFNTAVTVGLLSMWLWVLELAKVPEFKASSPESALNLLGAAVGGVGTGISLGFLLKHNSSMGGTDIIGKLIYKKNPVADVQWLIIGCDVIIVMASGILGIITIKDWHDAQTVLTSILSPILYSAISLVVCAEVADIIQSGLRSSIVFNVISDHHNEIAGAIAERLHRGVTMVHAAGFYTGVEHDMLVCVVRKKQINQVNAIIKEFDPEAFVYITKAKDVSGRGFTYHSPS